MGVLVRWAQTTNTIIWVMRRMANSIFSVADKQNHRYVPDELFRVRAEAKTRSLRLGVVLAYTVAIYAMFVGWANQDGVFFGAPTAPQYILGVLGGALILALLGYPLWKVIGGGRWKHAQRWWFRAHVAFGVIAPASIFSHANYQLASSEAQISMALMMMVAISGLMGRFLYEKTHAATGDRATWESLSRDKAYAKYKLAEHCQYAPQLRSSLQAYEIAALSSSKGFFDGICRSLSYTAWTSWHEMAFRRELNEALSDEASRLRWMSSQLNIERTNAQQLLTLYLRSVRRMSGLSFYEGLFSFWHALHLPLLMMLVAAAVIHVLGL